MRFRDNDHIASVAQKIAGRVGRRVDESSPMVDCRLPDGSRVNIIFPPLAIHSPCISIRKFPSHRLDVAVDEGLLELEANDDVQIVGLVANLYPAKGITHLINAAYLAKRYKESPRHTLQVDFHPYKESIEKEMKRR